MSQLAHAIAHDSYSRCLQASGFFPVLYEHLLASDPVIPPMFEGTAFPRQHKLLQHGLGLLLSYVHEPDGALLDRIAARHNTSGVNVHPSLYVHFVDSLVAAVREHDPECTEEVVQAWREAIAPGIEYMKARYAR